MKKCFIALIPALVFFFNSSIQFYPAIAAETIVTDNTKTSSTDTVAEPDDSYVDEWEEEGTPPAISDPLEPWNRAVFSFNDTFYFRVLKPVSVAYGKVIPEKTRVHIKKFFYNLEYPVRVINELLQFKIKAAQQETFAFIVNTTFGVLGFFDPAKNFTTLQSYPENTSQTFASWGIGNGFYIVWPFLGPSTARDTLGFAGDYVLQPISYINPLTASLGVRSYETMNQTSLTIGEYEDLKESSFDPYIAVRDAYIQHHKASVKE